MNLQVPDVVYKGNVKNLETLLTDPYYKNPQKGDSYLIVESADFIIWDGISWQTSKKHIQNPEEYTIQTFMDAQAAWADKAFGINRSPLGTVSHLKEEVDELYEALDKIYKDHTAAGDQDYKDAMFEFADCFLLIIDSARNFGMTGKNLAEVVVQKTKINSERKWGTPDENGVVHHISK